MPEGPSIIILKETLEEFNGKKIIGTTGSAPIDFNRLENKTVTFKTWGKHFLLCFDGFTIRIHLLMFGTYLINEQKQLEPKLSLTFKNGEVNFYTCNVKLLEGNVNDHYDWSADVMNDEWNAKKAKAKLKAIPDTMICDALLEQDIFSGLGNIIKNEVLYRVRLHPESLTDKIPDAKMRELIEAAQTYSFEFLKWKKRGELKKHWLAHTKKICKRCDLPIIKKYTGVKKRRSFYCENCQKLHQ